MKRSTVLCILLGIVIFSLSLPLSGCVKKAGIIKASGSLIVQDTKEDLKKGAWSDTVITDEGKGRGVIKLKEHGGKYLKTGTYTSAEIQTDEFDSLVLSYNADTPKGTYITVEGQIKVGETWSDWMTFASWGTYYKSGSGSKNIDNDLASIDVDTLKLKDQNKHASALKYRVTLNTEDVKATPGVRMIAAALQSNSQQAAVTGTGNTIQLDKTLDVPAYSQTIREPSIAGSICSPTSVSMVLNYYGIDILPEEVAWGAFDNAALIFGNWASNCAYAGSYGLDAYVGYFYTIDDLKREISKGVPVVASVKYKNSDDASGDLPVLHNAPISSTNGHLVVVCGFTKENGKEYVVVNDPAASSNEGVRVKYLVDEFYKAWNKYVYIISGKQGEIQKSRRIDAILEPTGKTKEYSSFITREYNIKVDNKLVKFSKDDVRLIITTADNQNFEYQKSAENDAVTVGIEKGAAKAKVIVIMKNGISYYSEVGLNN